MADSNKPSRVVLITAPMEEGWLQRLRSQWPDLRFEYRSARAHETVSDDLWREVEVLYMWFTTPLPPPEKVPKLRWVQLYSAGADYIFNHPLFHTQVIFTTTSGIHAIPIAEYVYLTRSAKTGTMAAELCAFNTADAGRVARKNHWDCRIWQYWPPGGTARSGLWHAYPGDGARQRPPR